jgi:SSS family solute:Na+ symporter
MVGVDPCANRVSFIIYFCGLPQQTEFLGWTFPTLAPVMLILLSLALTLTLLGGQIAIMITDFLQGQFVQIVILITFFVMLAQISWADLIIGLQMAPEEASRINPFKQGETKGFNAAFFIIVAALNVYGFKAWQGSQGYNAAPKSPHEAKMANILGMFRGQVLFLLSMLVPLFVFAMLHLPEFAVQASAVNETLASIDNPQIREQMRVPAGVAQLLPVGVMGLFAAMIIAAAVSTDDTYLHSWGSIFVQDVIMPFRKKPLSRKAHLCLLRSAIFAFIFSLLFPLDEYIFMYFQITGAIYLGGAGAVILGGLYWKRGSVEGAWAAVGWLGACRNWNRRAQHHLAAFLARLED